MGCAEPKREASKIGPQLTVRLFAGLFALFGLAALAGTVYLAVRAFIVVTYALNDPSEVTRFVANNHATLGPWVAAIVAVLSVGVLAHTNQSRAKESINNDFRESMQWALENLNQADDDSVRYFAYGIVRDFSENPPRNLHKRNKMLAQQVFVQATDEIDRQESLTRIDKQTDT